jgi:hypothetical protein
MQPKLASKKTTSEAHHHHHKCTSLNLGAAYIGTSLLLSGLGITKMAWDELTLPSEQSTNSLSTQSDSETRVARKRLTQAELITLQSKIAKTGARLSISESGLATINGEIEALSRHYLPGLISAIPGTLILGENVRADELSEIDLTGIALEGLVVIKSSLKDDDLYVLKDISALRATTIQTSSLSGEFLRLIADKGVRSLAVINDHELAGFNWRSLQLLSDFKDLEHLALSGRGMSIKELRLLPELNRLKSLSLSSTEVDPCALLETLLNSDKRYPNLETLYLPVIELSYSDKVKLEILRSRLKESRPRLSIY